MSGNISSASSLIGIAMVAQGIREREEVCDHPSHFEMNGTRDNGWQFVHVKMQ